MTEPAELDVAATRAEHEAHNYRVTALRNPHDCDGCGAEGAAKWDVLWSNEGRDEEPFLCDDCLAREFREIRLCDALDQARAERAAVQSAVTALDGRLTDVKRERDKAEAKLAAVEALFSGGPDTACRTTWPHGVECVEVPMADLRAAINGGSSE